MAMYEPFNKRSKNGENLLLILTTAVALGVGILAYSCASHMNFINTYEEIEKEKPRIERSINYWDKYGGNYRRIYEKDLGSQD